MKKIIFIVLMILVLAGVGNAQTLILNSPETLAVPTASKLSLDKVTIDISGQTVTVDYRFLTSGDVSIPTSNGSLMRRWTCMNIPAQLASSCTGVGEPYSGCTGVGTGEGLDPGSTCFTDTFSFVIRSQDVGTPIGKGLRALIWNKMRPDVLTGSNNATLP